MDGFRFYVPIGQAVNRAWLSEEWDRTPGTGLKASGRRSPLLAALALYWMSVAVLVWQSLQLNQGYLAYPLDDPYIHMADGEEPRAPRRVGCHAPRVQLDQLIAAVDGAAGGDLPPVWRR